MVEHTLALYVPRAPVGALAAVPPGSAIVGGYLPAGDGCICVDYEDGSDHGGTLRTFADRARMAASRHLAGADGAPRLQVPLTEVIRVGRYDLLEKHVAVAGPEGSRSLAHWLGDTELDQAELLTT